MIDGNNRTFQFGMGGAPKARLVKFSGGKAVLNTKADADQPVGVTEYAVSENEYGAVKLINGNGTFFVTTAGALAQGADAYAADDGKVSSLPTTAGTYRRVGICLEAATADGDIIEVLPLPDDLHSTVSE
jgi:hypothetical protein